MGNINLAIVINETIIFVLGQDYENRQHAIGYALEQYSEISKKAIAEFEEASSAHPELVDPFYRVHDHWEVKTINVYEMTVPFPLKNPSVNS